MQLRDMRAVATALIFLCASSVGFAHMGATGIVKERMDGMVAMKEALAVMGNMVRGKTETDFGLAAEAANTLQIHGEKLVSLFPDTRESRQKATEATEAVWKTPEDFAAKNAAFLEQVSRLQEVIAEKDADRLPQAFARIGAACSACHEIYRQKKQ